jgi:hypothetical protein
VRHHADVVGLHQRRELAQGPIEPLPAWILPPEQEGG